MKLYKLTQYLEEQGHGSISQLSSKLGISKEVLRQIKEEIKLMDQANECALKESLKNAETATQRKVAMEQRKRLADIRKEIKRVFSIAGSTPVPYKKPEFN